MKSNIETDRVLKENGTYAEIVNAPIMFIWRRQQVQVVEECVRPYGKTNLDFNEWIIAHTDVKLCNNLLVAKAYRAITDRLELMVGRDDSFRKRLV